MCIMFIHKRRLISVNSLLCGALVFCEFVMSDLCQQEADPPCLSLPGSTVHRAKRTEVVRNNTIK